MTNARVIQTLMLSCLGLLLSGPVFGVSTPPVATADPAGREAIQRSPRQTKIVTRYLGDSGQPTIHSPGPNRLFPTEDWGHFNGDHAVYVLAGTDTVIGRYRSSAGKKYLISNTDPRRHTAFSAKTRPEFESFLGYAERTDWLSVCEVQNPLTESCEAPAPAIVNLVAVPASGFIVATPTLTWHSQNTRACTASWGSSIGTQGSEAAAPISTTTVYRVTCTGNNGIPVQASARVTIKALDLSGLCFWSDCKEKIPKPPKPPKEPTSGGGGIGYCGASVAVCKAYDDTYGRAPEVGEGPKFWDDWLIDHGVDTDSQEFQTEFEAGCRGDDCVVLNNKKGSQSK